MKINDTLIIVGQQTAIGCLSLSCIIYFDKQ